MKKIFILWACLLVCLQTFANMDEAEIESKTQGFESQFSILSQSYLNDTPYKKELLRAGQLWQFCQEKRSEYFDQDLTVKKIAAKVEDCHNFAEQEVKKLIEEIKVDSSDPIKKQEAIKILDKYSDSDSERHVATLVKEEKTEDENRLSLSIAYSFDNLTLSYYYKAVQLWAFFDATKKESLAAAVERLEKETMFHGFAYDTHNIISTKTREFIERNPFREDYLRLTYHLLNCYNREDIEGQIECYDDLSYELYKMYEQTDQKPAVIFPWDEKRIEGDESNKSELYELRLILDSLIYRQDPCESLIKDKEDMEKIKDCFGSYVKKSLQDLQAIKYLYEGQPALSQTVLNDLEGHEYKVFFYNIAHMISEALQEQNLEKKAALVKKVRDFIKNERLFKLNDAKQINDFRQHIALMPAEIGRCQKPFEKKAEVLSDFDRVPELDASCFDDFARLYLSDPFQFNRGLWIKGEGEISVYSTDMISYSPKDNAWGKGVPSVMQNTRLGMVCVNGDTTILYIARENGDISFGNIVFTEDKTVTFSTGNESYKYEMQAIAEGKYLVLAPGSRSIPFIKKLLDKGYVSITFSEPQSPQGEVEQEYILTGLNDAINPIREQCGW